MEESVIYEKALNMKIMTLHEILLFIHSVVLCFDGTICTAYIWNYRASPCSHCCTLVKGAHGSSYWPKQTWDKSSTRTVPSTSG